MSTATVTVTPLDYPNGTEYTQKTQVVRGYFSISQLAGSPPAAATYATGGLAVAWVNELIKQPANPFEVLAWSVTGSGYFYVYNTSTNKLQVFEVGTGSPPAPFVELAATTVPAGVYNDVIQFCAVFAKLA